MYHSGKYLVPNHRGDDFRPAYKNLHTLRALIPSTVKFACMTGSVTEKVRQDIVKSLLITSFKTISIAAERPNIYLSQEKVKVNEMQHFYWLVQALLSGNCPKTLIYCRNVPQAANIYIYLSGKLGMKQYVDGIPSIESRTIEMFHRSTAPSNKEHILSELGKLNSTIRVVIATEAFGLGVDVPDIRVILFYGVPRSLESFVQQVGRAGRDGKSSCAHLLHFPLRNACTPQMKAFTKLELCRQSFVKESFRITISGTDFCFDNEAAVICACQCCDKCRSTSSCNCEVSYPFEATTDGEEIVEQVQDINVEASIAELVDQIIYEGNDFDKEELTNSILLCIELDLDADEIAVELDVSLDIASFIFVVLSKLNL